MQYTAQLHAYNVVTSQSTHIYNSRHADIRYFRSQTYGSLAVSRPRKGLDIVVEKVQLTAEIAPMAPRYCTDIGPMEVSDYRYPDFEPIWGQ